MHFSLKSLLSILIVFVALSAFGSGQRITIVSPQAGQVVKPNDTLLIELSQESTTSSFQNIAFSFGLNGRSNTKTDSLSLGRPYLSSQFVATDEVIQKNPGKFSFHVPIPSADHFTDGFDRNYQLKVAHFYLIGALSTPVLNVAHVQVTVKKQ